MMSSNALLRVLCFAVLLMEFGYSHQVSPAEFQFGGSL